MALDSALGLACPNWQLCEICATAQETSHTVAQLVTDPKNRMSNAANDCLTFTTRILVLARDALQPHRDSDCGRVKATVRDPVDSKTC